MGVPFQITSDSNIIMVCTLLDTALIKDDIVLIKADLNGNIIWSKSYGVPVADVAYAIKQTSDGGYIILGNSDLGVNNSYDALLLKTDSTGNYQWGKTYGSFDFDYGRSVIQTIDGGYLFSLAPSLQNYQLLVKTDGNGDTSWVKGFFSDLGYIESDVMETSNGDFVLVTTVPDISTGFTEACLVKVNPNGDTLWTQVYGNDTLFNTSFRGSKASDGGFVLVGNYARSAFDQDIYLIKSDSIGWSGCLQSGFHDIIFPVPTDVNSYLPQVNPVSITVSMGGLQNLSNYSVDIEDICLSNIIEESSLNKSTIEVYPNPTNRSITIKIYSPSEPTTLQIVNVLGEIVYSEKSFIGKENTIHFNLSAGIYFLRVKNKEKIEVKKIIID